MPSISARGQGSISGGDMRINIVAVVAFVAPAVLGGLGMLATGNPVWIILGVFAGVVLMQSPRVSQQWERAIILRLGKYVGMRGPGLFWIVPFIDKVSVFIDQRVMTTGFAAEQTLTADTVP